MLAQAGRGGEALDDQVAPHTEADRLEALGQAGVVPRAAEHLMEDAHRVDDIVPLMHPGAAAPMKKVEYFYVKENTRWLY